MLKKFKKILDNEKQKCYYFKSECLGTLCKAAMA